MANYIPRIEYENGGTLTVDFQLPPQEDFRNQKIGTSQKTSNSANGTTQTQFNYSEETQSPFFTLVPESVKNQYEIFFLNHGNKGLEFKYFPSNDEVEFITVTLKKFDFKPRILFVSNVPTEFIYEWRMDFRRVV